MWQFITKSSTCWTCLHAQGLTKDPRLHVNHEVTNNFSLWRDSLSTPSSSWFPPPIVCIPQRALRRQTWQTMVTPRTRARPALWAGCVVPPPSPQRGTHSRKGLTVFQGRRKDVVCCRPSSSELFTVSNPPQPRRWRQCCYCGWAVRICVCLMGKQKEMSWLL